MLNIFTFVFLHEIRASFSGPIPAMTAGPLLRNHNLGGKFQKGDLIFDSRSVSLYELLSKACVSYKALIVLGGPSPLFCCSSLCSGWGEVLWMAQGQKNMGLLQIEF